MRIARVEITAGAFLARIEDGKAVPLVADTGRPGHDPLREALHGGLDLTTAPAVETPVALEACRLLAPVREPQKVLGIGLNYADHAREAGAELPGAPIVFVKTTNSITGPGDPIRWRAGQSSQVDWEAELAVVIGRRARGVGVDTALGHVLGYTACNDVSARDAQFGDGQWVRGKSFDTFCPLGPWIVSADEIPDPQRLAVRCRVNGTTRQDSSTAEMVFGVAALISYLSASMTLEPGDVIATGTPAGVGFAQRPPVFLGDGDVVEVEIEGIGTLTNPVSVA